MSLASKNPSGDPVSAERNPATAGPVASNVETFPLSFAQQRLWFIEQLQPDSALYNQPDAWRIKGRINFAAFENAVNEIVRRHASLRTTFGIVDGQAVQRVAPPVGLPVPRVELQSAAQPELMLRLLLDQEIRTPFDLEQGPLFRPRLFQLSETEHVASFTAHHIVWDGWSIEVFRRELAALYNAYCQGRPSPLPELPIQYVDFALWQRSGSHGALWDEQLSYWKRQLQGPLPVMELPTAIARPAEPSIRGATEFFSLDVELVASLRALGRKHGATLFMTLLAAFKVVLHRYTRQEDVLVGSPIAGRDRSETEGMIGFFVNTLVLRSNLADDPTFLELLARVRDVTLAAYANQEMPFERIVQELQPERSLNRNPMFEVLFGFEGRATADWSWHGLETSVMNLDLGTAKFDWTLLLQDTAQGIQGTFEYCADLFEPGMIRRVLEDYRALLSGIATDPQRRISELPMVSALEELRQLPAWNRPAPAADALPVTGPAATSPAPEPPAPPRTPVEKALARIWSQVLGCPSISRQDNFFHLGGHSLLASQLVSRIGKAFQIELAVRAIFEAPTLQALAERIGKTPRATVAGRSGITKRIYRAQAEQLLSRLNELSDAEVESLLGAPEVKQVVP